jgi:diacylglycerol kinase (ATP)
MPAYSKAILFFNTKAGQSDKKKQYQTINAYFAEHKIDLEIIEVPIPKTELEAIFSQAIADGVDLFLAGGGDGTVSLVGNHLVGTGLPLGILPLGTGNLLAKELKIPHKLAHALALITASDHEIIKMDTFRLGDRYYILNLSVGLTPKIMATTKSEDKQRLGLLAYLINFFQQILGIKLHHFYLDHDHQKTTHLASEVLITNGRSMGVESLYWSEQFALNDGILDLLIIRATNIYDIFGLIISVFSRNEKANPIMKILQINEYCQITTHTPLPVQADGDTIGETPVEIQIEPRSLNIIISKNSYP